MGANYHWHSGQHRKLTTGRGQLIPWFPAASLVSKIASNRRDPGAAVSTTPFFAPRNLARGRRPAPAPQHKWPLVLATDHWFPAPAVTSAAS